MTFILVSLMIIIFIVYYLEKLQGSNSPKEVPIPKPAPQITPSQLQNIYGTKEALKQERENIEDMRIPPPLMEFHLVTNDESSPEVIDQILAITQSIPRPHPMLGSLTNRDVENADKLYQLVKRDPEIAAKILQTVNSSGFYLTQKITRLNHAILYLGTNMVKNIALQCIIRTQSEQDDPRLTQAFNKIWANGFLASSLTFLFAKNLEFKNAAELATQTLLAYIGNLAILSFRPQMAYCFNDSLSLFDRIQTEQRELGVNSALIGGELATLWQLPPSIVDGIRNNLFPLGIPPALCNLPKEYLRDIVLCYACCRFAEEIINKKLEDIAEVNLINPEQMELFYLSEYLNKTGLKGLLFLQNKPSFRNEANKMVQKIETFHSKERKQDQFNT
jgi:HD-like signal output (HDOD) protein